MISRLIKTNYIYAWFLRSNTPSENDKDKANRLRLTLIETKANRLRFDNCEQRQSCEQVLSFIKTMTGFDFTPIKSTVLSIDDIGGLVIESV